MFSVIWKVVLICLISLPLNAASLPFSVVVDINHRGSNGQLINGYKRYKTITAALSVAPPYGIDRFIIYIKPGRYIEQVKVTKPNITLMGAGRSKTVLAFGAAGGLPDRSGVLYGAVGSATLSISAPNFNLRSMTVENSFDFKKNWAKQSDDPSKIFRTQALAVMTTGRSDRASFSDCNISGYQDTLLLYAGRNYVNDCAISGIADFIFGIARGFFESCTIISRYDGLNARQVGVITAPNTSATNRFGFVFLNSTLTREPMVGDSVVYLGRPWRPHGMSVYINSWMDRHIHPLGWIPMRGTDANGNPVINQVREARFYESNSRGPGAVINSVRRQLRRDQLQKFTIANILLDWVPEDFLSLRQDLRLAADTRYQEAMAEVSRVAGEEVAAEAMKPARRGQS